MGPRQAVGSGRGRAGRGRECHLRPRTTLPPLLPISPSSSPGAHLPERPPPPPLQSPGPVPRRQARPGRLGRYVDAPPVSTACCSQLPAVQLACLLFRPGQEEKLEASTHLHHFLLFHVLPSQLLYISSSQVPHCVSLAVRQKETSFVKLNKYWF